MLFFRVIFQQDFISVSRKNKNKKTIWHTLYLFLGIRCNTPIFSHIFQEATKIPFTYFWQFENQIGQSWILNLTLLLPHHNRKSISLSTSGNLLLLFLFLLSSLHTPSEEEINHLTVHEEEEEEEARPTVQTQHDNEYRHQPVSLWKINTMVR